MNHFTLKIIAGLDKALSKRMIKSDLKSFDGQFTVKVIANLNKILSQRAFKRSTTKTTVKDITGQNRRFRYKVKGKYGTAECNSETGCKQRPESC